MGGSELAAHLNRNGHVADNGEPYVIPGRGIYHAISSAYSWVESKLGEPEAAHVANAYVDKYGEPAWKSKEE